MPNGDHADQDDGARGHLLNVRDQVAVVRDLIACLQLACQAPAFGAGERRALGAVIDVAREGLEAACDALDGLMASWGRLEGEQPSGVGPLAPWG